MVVVAGEPRNLFGCVATYAAVTESTTHGFLRRAFEDVFRPCLAGDVDAVQLALQWCPVGSQKPRWSPLATPDVDWAVITSDLPLAWVIVKGWRENEHEDDRSIKPLLAASVRFTDDARRASTLEFGLSMVLLDESISQSVQTKAVELALSASSEAEGSVGYITVDYVAPDVYGSMSPYERSVGLAYPWASLEFQTKARGYYWGNVLHRNHVGLLGGEDVLASAPVHTVREIDAERFYLQLTDDINDIDRSRLAQLREFLKPLLPKGYSQSQQYYDSLPDFVL